MDITQKQTNTTKSESNEITLVTTPASELYMKPWFLCGLRRFLRSCVSCKVVDGMNYYLHMMLYSFMFIAMATSWNLIGGYTGYTSLGHNVFYAVGGYFSGMLFLELGISPFITAPLAGRRFVGYW